jgi:hypothetical protein
MRRVFLKCLLVAAATAVLFLSMNAIYAEIGYDRYSEVRKFEEIQSGVMITVANTGSSHGLSFRYDAVELAPGVTSFNLAMVAQSLFYDYAILQNYRANFEGGGTLLIVLSFMSLHADETGEGDFEDKNMRYYKFLDAQHIRRFDPVKYVCVRNFPLLIAEDASSR